MTRPGVDYDMIVIGSGFSCGNPRVDMFGVQRMEFIDDVPVHCGAGVGGGSHVYGNTLRGQRHGSRFDITSGDVLRRPATEPVTTFDTRERTARSKPGLRFEGAPR